MKKQNKILGIALALVLLVSLFAFAVPVSANTLVWSGVNIPQVATNQLLAANPDPGKVAMSPNYATDSTIFAAVNDIVTPARPLVYKSTNGGYTWVPTASLLGAAGDIVVDLEVSPSYATDSTVFVATQTPAGGAGTGIVYRSTNGGANFSQIGVVTLVAGEIITSISVTPNYDGVGIIAVSVANTAIATVATAASNVQLWGSNGVLNWTAAGTAVAEDVACVQYSPNYPIDATLLAVTARIAGQVILKDNVGGVWNFINAAGINVGAATVLDFDGRVLAAVADLGYADIALPSDYNGTTPTLRRAYVSLVCEVGYAATGSNVYRVDSTTSVTATNPGVELGDIDYAGTYGAGTLMGGLANKVAAANNVYYTTTAMTTAPIWYPATNAPTGTTTAGILPGVATTISEYLSTAMIDMASDFATSPMVAAGTNGTDSAVAISKDAGVIYNERGLIDNGGAAITFVAGSTIEASPTYATDQTLFMTSTGAGGGANDTNVWRTQDAGAHWDRVVAANFATAGVGVIAISQQYATTSTVYVGDTTTVNIQYSNSNGEGWAARTIAAAIGVTIADMVSTDAGTLYVADAVGGQVARTLNSGWVWAGANTVATGSGGNLIDIDVAGTNVVVGDNAGTVWRSTNGGVAFARVGVAIVAANNAFVAQRGDHVYAQMSVTGDIYAWDVGTSTAWYLMTAVPAAGAGIVISVDNTMYALDPTAAVNTQVYRSINPEARPPLAPAFQWIAGNAAVLGRDIAVAAGGSNDIILQEGTNNTLQHYGDVLSAGSAAPVLNFPANGAALTTTDQAVYSVANVTGVTNWNYQFSNDQTFTNTVDATQNQVPPATQIFVDISATLAGISNELPVYWRARATTPLNGPWSETRSVNAEPQLGVNAPVLNAVATNLEGRASVTPVLSWAAFKNATGYQIQVAAANSPVNFTEANLVVDEVTGPVTTYAITDALDYNHAYGWRVRALTSAGSSDWSAAVGFLTEKEPVPTATTQPTYTITVPTSTVTPTFTVTVPPSTTTPTTITPGWIYAIIVVGAVLVIAVIVLIVRTRRIS